MKTNIQHRIKSLRNAMQESGIDALILPSNDPHQSEYVAPCWASRAYFSGFTGSAGFLVITMNHAGIWTDSRYFLQAEEELSGTSIQLHKQVVQHAPEHLDWLLDNLSTGQKIGVEASTCSFNMYQLMLSKCAPKNIELVNVEGIVEQCWTDRPALPDSEVYEHSTEYAGLHRNEKLALIRSYLKSQEADHYLVTSLDEIAWILNIRAWDIDHTPVAIAYLLISENETKLFVQAFKLNTQLVEVLETDQIQIKDYYDIADALETLNSSSVLYTDGKSLSWMNYFKINSKLKLGISKIMELMAIKNHQEIKHSRQTMVKDGVALTKFFIWLEKTIEKHDLKETEISEKLTYFRSLQEGYVGDSFPSIVGFESNGAIVHYRPQEDSCKSVSNQGLLLIDSGGQYLSGTTDITRMIHFGEVDSEIAERYTMVLKGNIALQNINFPRGTTGAQLDTLARMYLWNAGLDYGHGTGHGVGFFLMVHESPQGFTPNIHTQRGATALELNTITSNEPGFYKTGAYGIRIENLMLCVQSLKSSAFNAFEAITLFPIETNMIVTEMLQGDEKEWLNEYHEKVYAALSPHLNEQERMWLMDKCKPL